jgi:uncharacterized protein (DUF433 family)
MTETIPLALTEEGVLRVSGTRVTLETVMASFRDGATPEEIAQQYPSLPLGDIYEVIGYALRHPEEVNAYLENAARRSAEVRAMIDLRSNPDGIRERLLKRRREDADANYPNGDGSLAR